MFVKEILLRTRVCVVKFLHSPSSADRQHQPEKNRWFELGIYDSGVSFSFCLLSSGAVEHQNFVADSVLWFFFLLFWNWTTTYVIHHLLLQFFFRDQIISSGQSFAICNNCEAHTCDERNSFPPLLFPLFFVRVTNFFFLSSEMMTELCLTTVIRDVRCGEFCQNSQEFPLGRSSYLANHLSS